MLRTRTPKKKQPRHRQRIDHLAAGWETEFRHAFDELFEPAVERLNAVLDGRLSSIGYYAIVAILHDLALGHAQTLTGIKKIPRSK